MMPLACILQNDKELFGESDRIRGSAVTLRPPRDISGGGCPRTILSAGLKSRAQTIGARSRKFGLVRHQKFPEMGMPDGLSNLAAKAPPHFLKLSCNLVDSVAGASCYEALVGKPRSRIGQARAHQY